MKPIIGITAAGTSGDHSLRTVYTDYVERAGGIPVILPPCAVPEEVLGRLGGILISGGPDVAPAHFGVTAYDAQVVSVARPARDAFELALARLAYERDIPAFGICRGVQVMNVAIGGTLQLDIPAHVQQADRHVVSHRVDIVPGTRLHALIGADSAEVNSFHHQAVARPAPGLIVSARSDNGIIEAVEAPDRRFFLGVQWHPEHLSCIAANAIRGLIEAAADR